ncbi:MAG: D-alanine--D-alanine ligase family protein [Chloroflexota bacterium]
MTKKTKVGVFFGGRSGEHEVSLQSARSIIANLSAEKFEIIAVGISKQGNWYSGHGVLEALETGKIQNLIPVFLRAEPGDGWLYSIADHEYSPFANLDVIFPVLHGTFGEDGTLQGLFEMASIPYVGAGVLASAVGMDKALFKSVLRSFNLPVLDFRVITRHEIERDPAGVAKVIEAELAFPVFTKPANLGSSVGITKCRNRSDLMEGLLEAARFDRRILVEAGLEAPREIEVSVLGNENPQASLPGEVVPGDDFYTYAAKYLSDQSQLLIPAPLPEMVSEKIRRLAIETYRAIDCAGMARVDFLMDRGSEEIFISEVNTIPGFTRISMYPKLWEASGIAYPDLLERLINLAIERKADRDRTEFSYRRDL